MAAVEPAVTTVCAWDGKPTPTNNGGAELPAPLGGFPVIEAANTDEVIQLVAATPCARAKGFIEIRLIMFIKDEW